MKRSISVRFARSTVAIASAIVMSVTIGCAPLAVSDRQYLHSLNIEWDGEPFPIVKQRGSRSIPHGQIANFDTQLDAIEKNIAAQQPKRVLIFIHGGLNTITEALGRTEDATKAIEWWNKKHADEKVYPIFVNWHSLHFTLFDHLFRIREGRAATGTAWLTAPIVFVADAGRALTRLPATMFKETRSSLSNLTGIGRSVASVPPGWSAEQVQIDADYERDWGTRIGGGVAKVVPGAIKPVGMFLADALLYESYRMMLRRIDMMFRTEADYALAAQRHDDARSNGAVTKLLTKLSKWDAEYPEIALVGHSLGCIAVNEMLRRYPKLEIDDIVYMAAACTTKNALNTIPAYLERHDHAQFYSLCLHPFADKDESMALSTIPDGSLLECLDAFALHTYAPLERTFGKWNNAMLALPFFGSDLPNAVKRRIHIKGFPVRGDKFPKVHGDFDNFPFWDRRFWTPSDFIPMKRFR